VAGDASARDVAEAAHARAARPAAPSAAVRIEYNSPVELKATTYRVADRIATVTLDRPERLNAWTGRMHTEYRWCLATAQGDEAVRVIVVTGAGRGFCAGADAAALAGHVERGGYDSGLPGDVATPGYGADPRFDADFAYHFGIPKPIVAAINGPAAGVGLALACYCDVRLAAAGAKLTTAHGRLGLPAEFGLSWLLPRLIGAARAADLLLSSRVFLAEEALEMGLVAQVVAPGELAEAVAAYAGELATRVAPSSLAATKRQLYLDLHRGAVEAIEESDRLLRAMVPSAEFEAGVAALRAKRPPSF
jgi:enoyl-CoA hydratase/carnithine racemase